MRYSGDRGDDRSELLLLNAHIAIEGLITHRAAEKILQ